MINPDDLLALAHRLVGTPGEPEGRTAVSRAYYAAFHTTVATIEDTCGVILPTGPEIHRKVQFCLEQSSHLRLIAISKKLASLRTERNRADYNLHESRFADSLNVRNQLAIVEEIIDQLRAARTESVLFRDTVRTYANTVLKLRLTDA